jgi:hypothetical protein
MKPPPWTTEVTEPAERSAAEALATAQTEPSPWDARREREVLEAIRTRLETKAPRSSGRFGIAAFATAAVVLFAILFVRGPWRRSQTTQPAIEATEDPDFEFAQATPDHPAVLSVRRGKVGISAKTAIRYQLDAPGLKGQVDASVFWVRVAGALSTLEVVDGSAEIMTRSGKLIRIFAGQSIASNDPRLEQVSAASPATPTPTPALAPARATSSPSTLSSRPTLDRDQCAGLAALDARRTCYLHVAVGNDLAAQNAVLELGILEQEEAHNGASALEYWRSYQQRFPGGPLGPEASVAILGELLAEHRVAEARREADNFLEQFPQDGRIGSIRITRAELECQDRGAAALNEFTRLEQSPGVDRSELLYRRGSCESRLGQQDVARAHWRESLDLNPNGPRAEELRRLLGE